MRTDGLSWAGRRRALAARLRRHWAALQPPLIDALWKIAAAVLAAVLVGALGLN